jgi:hypothetical protein
VEIAHHIPLFDFHLEFQTDIANIQSVSLLLFEFDKSECEMANIWPWNNPAPQWSADRWNSAPAITNFSFSCYTWSTPIDPRPLIGPGENLAEM